MSNNQLYPFERNRYYPGKMLTSADFQAEQNYFINKSRFMNSLMYGSGIVCGCGVFSLDDLSILIESGVAIDGIGREIVIDSSIVKKLSAIDGFDRIESSNVSLCVRFKEQDVHSVYSVNHKETDKEYEFNRISEGYELFLVDSETMDEVFDMDSEFISKENLFSGNDYTGDIVFPTTACKGRNVKMVLEIRKLTSADTRLSCSAVIETPSFLNAKGEKEIYIDVEDISLAEGEVYKKDFWLYTEDTGSIETDIILRSGSATAFESDVAVGCASSFSMKIRLTDISPLELVNRETGRMNLEMRNIGEVDYIKLADIRLVRTEGAYVIEDITETGVKQYISSPSQELKKNDFLEFFNKDVDIRKENRKVQKEEKQEKTTVVESFDNKNYATGVLEIPLGKDAHAGDIRFSGEIAHGLGKGNVYVSVGYEVVADDKSLGMSAKSTIYGNPELFSAVNNQLLDAETAVKILNDKGSFVVAARLLRDVEYLVLSYRWVAIRFPAGEEMETLDYMDKSITAETPTVIMGPRESHFFGVRFNNMKNCSITYELTAPASGEITPDGIYTSPAKEGVYEVRIYCTDMPVICTYVYAIVKKTAEEEGISMGEEQQPEGPKIELPNLKLK
ncbi:MAG: hypothetical protein K6F99_04005 [Lachnospiraceae bacterium]|nr:hypothetical protein [Lachnospiraceae bacterium]